ncbi:hypothetical protein WA158_008130 [Blastocystis sp. Blastoise]
MKKVLKHNRTVVPTIIKVLLYNYYYLLTLYKENLNQSYSTKLVYDDANDTCLIKNTYSKTGVTYGEFERCFYSLFIKDPFGLYSRYKTEAKSHFPNIEPEVLDHWFQKLFNSIYGTNEDGYLMLPAMLYSIKQYENIDYKIYVNKNDNKLFRLIVVYHSVIEKLSELYNNELFIDASHSHSKDKYIIYDIIVLSSYNKKYVLGYMVDLDGEGKNSWIDFFSFLISRGVDENSKLVIHSDGLMGLSDAIGELFHFSTNVMCVFHARNIMYSKKTIKESSDINRIFFQYASAKDLISAKKYLQDEIEYVNQRNINDSNANLVKDINTLSEYLDSCDKRFCRFFHKGFTVTMLTNNPSEQIHAQWSEIVRKSPLCLFPFFFHITNRKNMLDNEEDCIIKKTIPYVFQKKDQLCKEGDFIMRGEGINEIYILKNNNSIIYTIKYIPAATFYCDCQFCKTEVICEHMIWFMKVNKIEFDSLPYDLAECVSINEMIYPLDYSMYLELKNYFEKHNPYREDIISEKSCEKREESITLKYTNFKDGYSYTAPSSLAFCSLDDYMINNTVSLKIINIKTGDIFLKSIKRSNTIKELKEELNVQLGCQYNSETLFCHCTFPLWNIFGKEQKLACGSVHFDLGELDRTATKYLQQLLESSFFVCENIVITGEKIPEWVRTSLQYLSGIKNININWDLSLHTVFDYEILPNLNEKSMDVNLQTPMPIQNSSPISSISVQSINSIIENKCIYDPIEGINDKEKLDITTIHENTKYDDISTISSKECIFTCNIINQEETDEETEKYEDKLYEKAKKILKEDSISVRRSSDLYLNDFIIDTYINYLWLAFKLSSQSKDSINTIYIIDYFKRIIIDRQLANNQSNESPQQHNSYDCGCYLLMNTKYIIENYSIWINNPSISYTFSSSVIRSVILEKMALMSRIPGYNSVKRCM